MFSGDFVMSGLFDAGKETILITGVSRCKDGQSEFVRGGVRFSCGGVTGGGIFQEAHGVRIAALVDGQVRQARRRQRRAGCSRGVPGGAAGVTCVEPASGG